MSGKWLERLRGVGGREPDGAEQAAREATPALQSIALWQPRVDVDALFCRWLLGAPQGAKQDAASAQALLQSLAAALDHPREALIPRVPALVPQLLHGLRDPRRSIVALSRQVAQDPVLVAAVLRRVNSAYYRAGKHIESLEQALLIIGHDGLRHLLAAVALKPLINVQSGTYTRRAAPIVWEASERCGLACHVLALAAGTSPFAAFLGALLYNVGAIVLLRELDWMCDDASVLASSEFCAGFMPLARTAACAIGRRWRFPSDVLVAVAPPAADAGSSALADVLRASDRIGKLRILVDAGVLARDEALDLDAAPIMGVCFDKLGSMRAA